MATVSISPRTSPSTSGTPRRSTAVHVGRTGLVAAAAGAGVLYVYGTAAAAVGVPMRAGDPWAAAAVEVAPANFAFGVVVCTFWGTLLALGLATWAGRPARLFVRAAIALVLVSLAVPLAAVDTAVPTRITLALGHLLAAAVVVPLLARALRSVSPRR